MSLEQNILVKQNMLESLKITGHMDKEPSLILTDQDMSEIGKAEKIMEMEIKSGRMEENMLDNLKMTCRMEKELFYIQINQNTLGSLKMVKDTAKEP